MGDHGCHRAQAGDGGEANPNPSACLNPHPNPHPNPNPIPNPNPNPKQVMEEKLDINNVEVAAVKLPPAPPGLGEPVAAACH